jgi:hypothetical protein
LLHICTPCVQHLCKALIDKRKALFYKQHPWG